MAILSLKYEPIIKRLRYQPFSVGGLMLQQQADILGVDIVAGRSKTLAEGRAFAERVLNTLGGTENLLKTAEATRAFGPQYRRLEGFGLLTDFRLPTLQRPTEKNVFGETIAPGTFISGPGIKKLDIAGLRQAGALSASYTTSEPMAMGMQGRLPIGDLGGLTFSQRIALADVQTEALAPTVGIASPLSAYTTPSARIPDVTLSRYQAPTPIEGPSAAFSSAAGDYYSYITQLPELAVESARATASSLTPKTVRERGVGEGLSTGVFEVDVAADIATIPFEQEVKLQRFGETDYGARSTYGTGLANVINKQFDAGQQYKFFKDPLLLNVPRLPDYEVSRISRGTSSIPTRSYSLPSNLNLPRLLPR